MSTTAAKPTSGPPPTLRANAPAASFLPADYVARKSEQRANLLSLTLFGIVMMGVVGAFGVTNRAWSSVREERIKIDDLYAAEAEKIEQLKQLEEQRAAMMEKAEVTAALIENVPRSVLLGELVLRLPEEVKLTGLDLKSKRVETKAEPPPNAKTPQKNEKIKSLADLAKNVADAAKPKVQAPRFEYTMTLTGVAANNNDIADYIRGLRECVLLKGVELKYIKETHLHERDLRMFEVEAQIRPEADGRSLAASLTQRLHDAGGIDSKTGGVVTRPNGKAAGAGEEGATK
jgi:Tfp pilus assembly protein PilN